MPARSGLSEKITPHLLALPDSLEKSFLICLPGPRVVPGTDLGPGSGPSRPQIHTILFHLKTEENFLLALHTYLNFILYALQLNELSSFALIFCIFSA